MWRRFFSLLPISNRLVEFPTISDKKFRKQQVDERVINKNDIFT